MLCTCPSILSGRRCAGWHLAAGMLRHMWKSPHNSSLTTECGYSKEVSTLKIILLPSLSRPWSVVYYKVVVVDLAKGAAQLVSGLDLIWQKSVSRQRLQLRPIMALFLVL